MSILQTINLKKYYGTKPNITRALDGVNFTVEQENLLLWLELPAAESLHCFT